MKKPNEKKFFGLNACLKLAEVRPEDIIRVSLTKERTKTFSKLLSYCAAQKLAYHVVSPAELEKISGSKHHEGICILARTKKELRLPEFVPPQKGALLYLHDVGNPHNAGAVVRTAAHFGFDFILLDEGSDLNLSGSTARTAEGGGETVTIVRVPSAAETLKTLKKAGYRIKATSPRGSKTVFEDRLCERALFILGAEGTGLPRNVISAADDVLTIPGTGNVESLSVVTAAAVLMADYYRKSAAAADAAQHKPDNMRLRR